MSRITDVYNAFLAECNGTLLGYSEMANPYISDENPINLFDKSFGIQISNGLNSKRLTKPKQSTDRQLILVMIQKLNSTESFNAGLRAQQLSMMEDLFSMIQATCNDGTINGVASKFDYDSDTGIEFIDAGNIKYYILEAIFNFEYFDDL